MTDRLKTVYPPKTSFCGGYNDSEKGHNSDKKKNTVQLFFHEESVYEISKP